MTRSSRQRGFTLLEVVIAVAITAVMGLMVTGALRQIDRAQQMTRDQGDRYTTAQLALARLASELSMAFISEHWDNHSLKALRERPTAFIGKDDTILFTTFAHQRLARDARESDQEVVEYTLESDPAHSGEEVLFRRAKARIDEELERGGRKDVVADHIASFRLQYWDPRKNDWAREWSTRSTDHPNDLPTRVRIELELKVSGDRTEKLVTEARIALTKVLVF
jgi:general secretion pathway protein J